MTRFLLILMLSVPVSLSGQAITRLGNQVVTGNMTTSGDVIAFTPIGAVGFGTVGIEAAGTWTGTATIECAAGSNGAFVAIELLPRNSTTAVTTFTANGQWSGSIAGCLRVQARATAAMTGTLTITMVGAFQ